MASIVFRNSSRRLLRAYFSKLGWQANVIWRIAFFNQLQVYPSWLWRSDLFRASLTPRKREPLSALPYQAAQAANRPIEIAIPQFQNLRSKKSLDHRILDLQHLRRTEEGLLHEISCHFS